jgi:hypothetical protein
MNENSQGSYACCRTYFTLLSDLTLQLRALYNLSAIRPIQQAATLYPGFHQQYMYKELISEF